MFRGIIKKIDRKGCSYMAERLTREQMAEKYPNQSIGITNIKYENNDGVTIE